ncbi:hypothetical protein LCGC14_0801310 [marine sediment metagenome]|uniref:Uncharacterized protein n=1 Tax=marine sediment metagenome TaxID=412755 RepID=A0A0F9PPF6_9ZZZZ
MTDGARWRSYFVSEPLLTFGHRQVATNPKDGLFLFGPVNDRQSPLHMRVGVIGTEAGIRRYSRWVKKISRPIAAPEVANPANTYMWPGFEAVFGAVWGAEPFASCHVDADELSRLIRIGNRSEAIYSAVGLYEMALRKYLREEEAVPDMWFVVVPEEIHRYGRPKSSVPKAEREEGTWPITKAQAKRLNPMPLFGADEADEAAQKYDYVPNFQALSGIPCVGGRLNNFRPWPV